jgi:hypothetical protein
MSKNLSERDKKYAYFWIFLLLGGALAFTPIFAPIHELGHLIEGSGRTYLINWRTTHVGQLDLKSIIAGYKWEFIFTTLMTVVVYQVLKRKKKIWWMALPWGYTNGVMLAACSSYDFQILSKKISVYPEKFVIGWLLCTVPILFIGWVIIIGKMSRNDSKVGA